MSDGCASEGKGAGVQHGNRNGSKMHKTQCHALLIVDFLGTALWSCLIRSSSSVPSKYMPVGMVV